jgi:hypothetical protein
MDSLGYVWGVVSVPMNANGIYFVGKIQCLLGDVFNVVEHGT